jgi:hypothetical protein
MRRTINSLTLVSLFSACLIMWGCGDDGNSGGGGGEGDVTEDGGGEEDGGVEDGGEEDTTEEDTTEEDTTEEDTTEGDTTEEDTTEGDTTEEDTAEGDSGGDDTTESDTGDLGGGEDAEPDTNFDALDLTMGDCSHDYSAVSWPDTKLDSDEGTLPVRLIIRNVGFTNSTVQLCNVSDDAVDTSLGDGWSYSSGAVNSSDLPGFTLAADACIWLHVVRGGRNTDTDIFLNDSHLGTAFVSRGTPSREFTVWSQPAAASGVMRGNPGALEAYVHWTAAAGSRTQLFGGVADEVGLWTHPEFVETAEGDVGILLVEDSDDADDWIGSDQAGCFR